uniref:Uncharacterized protein n=1 Tax=viral metagenome TaxID=1070528 RepID=A0A2V0RJK6_9ZZZZ
MFKQVMMLGQAKKFLGSLTEAQTKQVSMLAKTAVTSKVVDPAKKPILASVLDALTQEGPLADNVDSWMTNPTTLEAFERQKQIKMDGNDMPKTFVCPHCSAPTDLS